MGQSNYNELLESLFFKKKKTVNRILESPMVLQNKVTLQCFGVIFIVPCSLLMFLCYLYPAEQKPLAMRIRMSYKVNGEDRLEQGQVSNFPSGLQCHLCILYHVVVVISNLRVGDSAKISFTLFPFFSFYSYPPIYGVLRANSLLAAIHFLDPFIYCIVSSHVVSLNST